jgi:hypothetical protein
MVLMNNVMGLKNRITMAFLGNVDTLLKEKKGKKFCHFIAKVEGTRSNYAKWCKYRI